ncbi:MAG: glycosyltransferase family 39 protein, partial [bacterium]|nr:glycosyltransferase family 39 protein [bacterium]
MRKVFLIIFIAVILYLPAMGVFFSGDDFFHLRISSTQNIQDFVSFFSFEKGDHSASFYRPLTTQVFFFIGEKLFGLSPFGYHYFSIIFFAIVLYLVYFLVRELLKDERVAILSVLFYAFSASHFTQVYYLSAFQELGMTVFYLAGLLAWIKFLEKKKQSKLFLTLFLFILALLSKETAITFPVVALIIGFYLKKKNDLHWTSTFFAIGLIYLFFRFLKFGQVAGASYVWDFSLRVFNTLSWYGVWALGLPEMFLDFIGPDLHLNPNLLLYYPWQTGIIVVSFVFLVFLILLSLVRHFKNKIDLIAFCALFFIVTLLPVLFLPWHKFPLELTLPLFPIALFLGTILRNVNVKFLSLFIISFLILNLTSYLLTYQTHWVTGRGEVAKRVLTYFAKNYPVFPLKTIVYFYNDSVFVAPGWGASKQISETLS